MEVDLPGENCQIKLHAALNRQQFDTIVNGGVVRQKTFKQSMLFWSFLLSGSVKCRMERMKKAIR